MSKSRKLVSFPTLSPCSRQLANQHLFIAFEKTAARFFVTTPTRKLPLEETETTIPSSNVSPKLWKLFRNSTPVVNSIPSTPPSLTNTLQPAKLPPRTFTNFGLLFSNVNLDSQRLNPFLPSEVPKLLKLKSRASTISGTTWIRGGRLSTRTRTHPKVLTREFPFVFSQESSTDVPTLVFPVVMRSVTKRRRTRLNVPNARRETSLEFAP